MSQRKGICAAFNIIRCRGQQCPPACTTLALTEHYYYCVHACHSTRVGGNFVELGLSFHIYIVSRNQIIWFVCQELLLHWPPCSPFDITCHSSLKLDCKTLVLQLYRTLVQGQRGTGKAPWHEANSVSIQFAIEEIEVTCQEHQKEERKEGRTERGDREKGEREGGSED